MKAKKKKKGIQKHVPYLLTPNNSIEINDKGKYAKRGKLNTPETQERRRMLYKEAETDQKK